MAEVASEVIVARTGRNCQRYEEKFRLVAGCIPYRLKTTVENGADNLQDRLEVLMISSPNRQDLIFPKGGWENDETIVEAASREALEEAGVRGIIKEVNSDGSSRPDISSFRNLYWESGNLEARADRTAAVQKEHAKATCSPWRSLKSFSVGQSKPAMTGDGYPPVTHGRFADMIGCVRLFLLALVFYQDRLYSPALY